MNTQKILSLSETCTGCFACYNICPKNAITMPENEEGFYFPSVDNDKCIQCGLCDKVCPQVTGTPKNKMCKAYYGWSLSETIRKNSSSGGMFRLLADYVIEKGGIVYGASFNFKELIRLECRSTEVVSLEDLQRSKYVQSYIGYAFREIKAKLQNGKYVLFCGTPCQTAGLKAFLGKDYSKLIMADFVCHGVPSMDLLRKHLDYLKIKNLKQIVFRPKNRGWVDDFEVYYTKKRPAKPADMAIRKVPWQLDEYFDTFERYQSIRRSCRCCSYCNGDRASDITLADFWRINDYDPQLWNPKGVSMILANTDKGLSIIDIIRCDSKCVIEEVPLQYVSYVYERNRTDLDSPYQNKVRDKFLHDVYSIGYEKALDKNGLKVRKLEITKYRIKEFVKRVINK